MAPAARSADELIRVLDESCTATLASLKRPTREPAALSSAESSSPPSLSDIRNDVLAHLQAISKEVTAISLALRPPVSQDALKGTLEKLVGVVGKLVYAAELLPRDGTLAKRMNWTVQESLEAFQHFLSSISSTLAAPSSSAKSARDELLRSAKTVWSVVDKAQEMGDDLAAALEPPQDELKEAVEEVLSVGEELAKCIEGAVDERGSEEVKKAEMEWLGVWRKQRDTAKAKLDAI
ncbi:Proteophosphoglycan 5 [Rhodotorula toruloides ATCC 204091]|uniref:Proteophosphoglycan 5 n=1 Tax=Rhodotorula toruloides TaxID=5286 RepID=A0A0K3CN60_RHOTO|nr:Proteophosphoglycan 5 [Rhodotorula toruloides ATCC 204091]PRQ70545.1 Proteophosphoglycan 5 [Rhodotorula toruloides]